MKARYVTFFCTIPISRIFLQISLTRYFCAPQSDIHLKNWARIGKYSEYFLPRLMIPTF